MTKLIFDNLLNAFFSFLALCYSLEGSAQTIDSTSYAAFWAAVTPTEITFADPSVVAEFEKKLEALPVLESPVDTFCSAGGIQISLLTDPNSWPHYLARLRHQERGGCVKEFLVQAEKLLNGLPPEARLILGLEKTNLSLYDEEAAAAIKIARENLRLAAETKNLEGWAQYSLAKALYMQYTTFDELTLLTESALHWAEARGDWELQMYALILMGKINRDIFFGHTLKAIPYLEKARALAESHQDSLGMYTIYISLSHNYEDARLLDKEIFFAQKALNILEKLPSPRCQATILYLLGRYYDFNNQPEKRRLFRDKALALVQKTQAKAQLGLLLDSKFGELLDEKRYNEAFKLVQQVGLLLKNEMADKYYGYYKATGNFPMALQWLEKAYNSTSSQYMNRNALLLSYWEAIYRTKEKEMDSAIRKKQRDTYIVLLLLSASLLALIAIALALRIKLARKLKQQNTLIEQQSKELLRLDEIKSRFFTNVSHELRTPLTLILGPLNYLLKKDNLGKDVQPTLLLMRQNSQQLLFLVNEILDISKLDANKMVLREETVLFYPLMRRLASSFESHASYLELELVFEYKADRNMYLVLDQNLFIKVFYNLLSNALKFTPKGGKVSVSIEDLGQNILLTVKDTGRGIHPDDLPHVFDRFYQSKLPNANTEGGTGIGLAFCTEVARLMQGRVWVESQLKVGSTFYFSIPKKESLGYQPETNESPDNLNALDTLPVFPYNKTGQQETFAPTTGEGSIFIVEDNYSLRQYLKQLLSEYYQVTLFSNGLELWEHLSSLPQKDYPNLVITDLMMPEMDGYQLLTKVKGHEQLQRIPIIVLTAKASAQDRLQALRVGVDDYLLKPFDEDELIARVDGLIANARLRLELNNLQKDLDAESPVAKPSEPEAAPLNATTKQQQEWLADLNAFIEKNLANSDLDAEGVAFGLNISRSTLYRFLRDYTGLTPAQYLAECRFRKARYLLENGLAQSVKGVSYDVGYRQVKHFSKEFKQRYGKSPSDYLKEEQ